MLPYADPGYYAQAQAVAHFMGKGATIDDALDLPLLEFNIRLMLQSAEATAAPVRQEFEMERAKRRAAEEKERREFLE